MPEQPNLSNQLQVRFDEFEVDEQNARLIRNGTAISLAPTPFGLLCALLRQPGFLLTKHALLDQVWGHRFVSDSVLKGAISEVRKVLGDDPRSPRYIETVPRRGYRFLITPTALNEPVIPVDHGADVAQIPTQLVSTISKEAEPSHLFVGRKVEMVRLRQVWERVLRGSRAIVWIAGEPGIGKTTLIEHFTSGLEGVVCVRGQCVQHHGLGEPYLPVLEALAELCRCEADAVGLLRAIAPTWLLQMPWLSTPEQRESLLREMVGVNPQRMLREMSEFMDRYTERMPLLLITEDLHWADNSTIQLIEYFARRRSSGRLMWLSSYRLTEIIAFEHSLNALRHELRPLGLCDEIVLDAFSETEVASYIAGRAPAMAANEQFVQVLHQRTEGLPLFIASIANEVINQATSKEIVNTTQLASTTIPESLSDLIDHYILKLTNERRALLTAAAVYGIELHIDTLSRVLGLDVLRTAEMCADLARERLWLATVLPPEEGNESDVLYQFRHALFRQRLYDGMAISLRTELHRKIGTALEELRSAGQDVAAAEIATHFERGRSPMTALHYYAEAAIAALQHLSPAEGLSLTERALALANQVPAGGDNHRSLVITLATLRGVAAFHLLGAGDDSRNAYLQAANLLADDPQNPMAGLTLHGFGFLLYLRGEYSEALRIAKRAQALASENNDPLLTLAACTVEGQVQMIKGQYLAARKTLELALPELERSGAMTEQSTISFIVDPWDPLESTCRHASLSIL